MRDYFFSIGDTSIKNWLTDIIITLILAINFILLFALEINDGDTLDNPRLFGMKSDSTKILLTVLGVMIVVLIGYTTLIQGIIMVKLQKAKAIGKDNSTKKMGGLKRFFQVVLYMIKNIEETLVSRSIGTMLLCFGFSIAGISVDYFWFAFTLIYLIIIFPQTLGVLMAIWQPRKEILFTVAMSAIVLYWFAIIAYVYFGDDFNSVVEGSNMTLIRCFALVFDSWYKYGLGAFLADNGKSAIFSEVGDDKQYKIKGARIGFDFMFFFIVPTLLLSILSGIIIDNFGERRAHNKYIEQRRNDQ